MKRAYLRAPLALVLGLSLQPYKTTALPRHDLLVNHGHICKFFQCDNELENRPASQPRGTIVVPL
jgi:hypothetical protein